MTEDLTQFYEPWQPAPLQSWQAIQQAVNELTTTYPGHRLLWRGARDSRWGVHSSLSRTLRKRLDRWPTEDEMVEAELATLEKARQDWRFDGRPALELFAQLQHFGGPTRLIDVTENPLVALWFATEEPGSGGDDHDARVFAFVTPKRDVRLNAEWLSRYPRWHLLSIDEERRRARWGTGLGRRYWKPPAYHERISAQNAGFLLDGVPIQSSDNGFGRTQLGGLTWNVDEMRQLGSISLKLTMIKDGSLPTSAAPVFTFVIAQGAKAEIREQLEWRYGYGASTLYPDMFGLARYLADHPEQLR